MNKKRAIPILVLLLCLLAAIILYEPTHAPMSDPPNVPAPASQPPASPEIPQPAASKPSEVPLKADAPSTYIAGKVINAADNTPVTEFWLTAAPREANSVFSYALQQGLEAAQNLLQNEKPIPYTWIHVTDSEGRFRLTEFETGEPLAIWVYSDSHMPGYSKLDAIAPGQTRTGVKISLLHGARIEGLVTNTNGMPVASATISNESKDISTTTDESGQFLLKSLPPSWRFRVQHPDYAEKIFEADTSEGAKETVHIVLDNGGIVEGYVTRGESPVVDAAVSLRINARTYYASCRTNNDGYYVFQHMPSGEGELVLLETIDVITSRMSHVSVLDHETTRVDFELSPEVCTLEGVITIDGEAANGSVSVRRVTGAVAIVGYAGSQLGSYLLEGLEPGIYEVNVSAYLGKEIEDLLSEATPEARVTSRMFTKLEIQAGQNYRDFVLEQTAMGTIHGAITSITCETGVIVRAILADIDTSVDVGLGSFLAGGCLVKQDGDFVIEDVLPGRYRLQICGTNLLTMPDTFESELLEVLPGSQVKVNIALPNQEE